MTDFEQRLRATLSHAYDIDRELGGGGMSRVFVATDRALGRKVVIKLLSPELTQDVNRGRFRREIQVAAQLQHPHIVPLLSAGEHEDLLYFTMPFIKGESLKSSVDKNGPLSVEETVRVLYHVGEALDYAHGAGVVHRDIKPANILRSGTYFLVTDFGVAKALNASMPSTAMTSTGMAIGTPAYMAPEQLAGDAAADHRIDIYAVGLLAYELLKGKSPFAATTPQRVLAAVLTQDPPPLIEVRPDVPRSLSEVVMRCLAKEPEARPESAKAFLEALDMFSTASGEIRTMEHKVPRTKTPFSNVVTSGVAREETPSIGDRTPTAQVPTAQVPTAQVPTVEAHHPVDQIQAVEIQGVHSGYLPEKKDRKKWVAGGIALLVPIAGVAVIMSQRSDNAPLGVSAPPANAPVIAESASVQPPLAGAVPESVAVVPNLDSQRVADSVKRVARAEMAKKAAAKKESLQNLNVEAVPVTVARRAVASMFADAGARKLMERGATHMGGVLNKQRRGDLQTQINALVPFLTQSGLSYEHFKLIVANAGITLFDEFGRMKPDALKQFAGVR